MKHQNTAPAFVAVFPSFTEKFLVNSSLNVCPGPSFLEKSLTRIVPTSLNNRTKTLSSPQHKTTSTRVKTTTRMSAEEIIVRLQHPGTCTGMYWRGEGGKAPPSNDNWPRNGALLKGTGPHRFGNEDYFKVSAIQQAGKDGFVPVPEGTYMLYNQGGLLLHPVNK